VKLKDGYVQRPSGAHKIGFLEHGGSTSIDSVSSPGLIKLDCNTSVLDFTLALMRGRIIGSRFGPNQLLVERVENK